MALEHPLDVLSKFVSMFIPIFCLLLQMFLIILLGIHSLPGIYSFHGWGGGRHCRKRDSYGTRCSCNRLIGSQKRWNEIFELAPLLAQKRGLLLKLSPVKIYGTSREIIIAIPLLFQGVNIVFFVYIHSKKSNLLHEE